jgi:hypothetical protein
MVVGGDFSATGLARPVCIEVAECMVRRLTAREKFVEEESLRQCIRPVCGDVSPGHDEIRRAPVL